MLLVDVLETGNQAGMMEAVVVKEVLRTWCLVATCHVYTELQSASPAGQQNLISITAGELRQGRREDQGRAGQG